MKMMRVRIVMGAALAVSMVGFGEGVTDDAFKGLSANERIDFVRSMNAMLPNFPAATQQSRIETIYRLNRDFIKAAPIIDRRRVLAEVYATVPDYALPALTDGLSSKIFNRAAMGFKKDDDSFQNFALSAMLSIYRRCRIDNNLSVTNNLVVSNQRRIAFAVVMFLKASEGIPEDFLDQLIAFVPDTVRDIAREEWIPQAMGVDDKKPTYEPMLAAATNDVDVAKAEMYSDDRRQVLKYPNSEQQRANVKMAQGINDSTLLLVPKFEDEYEGHYGPEPKHRPRPCPAPYDSQQF